MEGVPEPTPRQTEVLALLVVGKSAREICHEPYLSQATVPNQARRAAAASERPVETPS